MGKKLVLLANAFPYGSWEPYLETEIKYYDAFESVIICSLQTRKNQLSKKRELPSEKFQVCVIMKVSAIRYLLNSVYVITDGNFYKEIYELIKKRRFSIKRLIRLVAYISRSHYEANHIIRYLKNEHILQESEGVIYSYRFEYQPYVGLLVKKKFPNYKAVSRGHGYDLYEERNSDSYIPMRKAVLQGLDHIYMISNDGKCYIESKYPQFSNKISIARLGIINEKPIVLEAERLTLNIVSCSNVIPLKRVELIAKSLKNINDFSISWTHYGDGILMDELKDYCAKHMPSNIYYRFLGNVPNKQVLEDYRKNNYHIFINVSNAEGIPVSIMEAMAYGIPCIATDVGGTKEILNDGVEGILLEKDFSIEDLTKVIRCFSQMAESEYLQFRRNARFNWESRYNADVNYKEFIDSLISL